MAKRCEGHWDIAPGLEFADIIGQHISEEERRKGGASPSFTVITDITIYEFGRHGPYRDLFRREEIRTYAEDTHLTRTMEKEIAE